MLSPFEMGTGQTRTPSPAANLFLNPDVQDLPFGRIREAEIPQSWGADEYRHTADPRRRRPLQLSMAVGTAGSTKKPKQQADPRLAGSSLCLAGRGIPCRRGIHFRCCTAPAFFLSNFLSLVGR